MNLADALLLAEQGQLVARPAFAGEFLTRRGGKTLRGHFIGETGLAEMRAYSLSEEDRRAEDWRIFRRLTPDAWEGCDAPTGTPRRC